MITATGCQHYQLADGTDRWKSMFRGRHLGTFDTELEAAQNWLAVSQKFAAEIGAEVAKKAVAVAAIPKVPKTRGKVLGPIRNKESKASSKSSMHRGISFQKSRGYWVAKYKSVYLGKYESEEAAISAWKTANEEVASGQAVHRPPPRLPFVALVQAKRELALKLQKEIDHLRALHRNEVSCYVPLW